MKRCLILREDRPEIDLELLEVARLMFGETVVTLGLGLGDPGDGASDGFDFLVSWKGGVIPEYDTANLAAGVAKLYGQYRFDAILVPATPWGRVAAPRLAMRLGTGLVADVTGLGHGEHELEMIRPAYSGKLMAGVVNQGAGPVMMTVRPGAFPAWKGKGKRTERIVFEHQPQRPCGLSLLGTREKPPASDIRDAEVLVSGGGGVMDQFSRLEELAAALEGQVSASRRVIDSGVAPRRIQVGQSGKTVSPRLYLALGIDGSTQHLEGLKKVEHLIAVNTNPDAPLCSVADVVVVGDAIEFLDRFLERINRHKIPGG